MKFCKWNLIKSEDPFQRQPETIDMDTKGDCSL